MTKFVESEAVEEEDSNEEGGGKPVPEEDFDSSEDDNVPDEYEDDGFLVDEDEEEEEQGERKKKKKRKRKHSEPQFEEGDLTLLEDAGVKVKKKGKLRRLKRGGSDEEDQDDDRRNSEEERPRKGPDEDIDYDEDEGDEMDNFIEDDEGGRRRRSLGEGVNAAAIDAAREIFGDEEDVEDLQGIDFLVATDDEEGKDPGAMQRTGEDEQEEEIRDLDDMRKLTMRLDPTLAATRYMTERDEEIRKKDMPEFLQEHFGNRKRPGNEELTEEASWIYRSAFLNNPEYENVDQDKICAKIAFLLSFMHAETLDIPFVAVYRKEYVMDDLMKKSTLDKFGDWSGLWTVVDWDKRWGHLNEHKKDVIALLNKALEQWKDNREEKMIMENLLMFTKTTDKEAELASVEKQVALLQERLYAVTNTERPEEKGRRRPRRRERYRYLCKSGLRSLAKKFGLSAGQLSENLQKYQSIYRPEDPPSDPQDLAIAWATEAKTPNLEDPMKCLTLARNMITAEIVCDTGILRHVRDLFMSAALVSTTPSMKARKDIDDSHPLRPYCTIQRKPVADILRSNSGEFRMMVQAEEEGLAELEMVMKEAEYGELVDDFNRFYLSQNLSATAMAWNEQRKLIIKDALDAIIESLRQELRQQLLEDAQLKLMANVTRAFDEELHQGPIQLDGVEGAPRVLAISITEKVEDEEAQVLGAGTETKRRYQGNAPLITLLSLDEDGEVIDTQELPGGFLRRRKDDPIPADISSFLWDKVVKMHEPNCVVIGIGSGGKDPIRLKEDLQLIFLDNMAPHATYLGYKPGDSRDYDEKEEDLKKRVVLVPDEIAHPFSNSQHVTAALAELTVLQRKCVALGRLAQEPLCVYASIISDQVKAFSVSFTSYDHLLNNANRKEALRRSMVRAVNTVGFDINRSIIHSSFRPMLKFVGGLGPRKAEILLKAIESSEDGFLLSRADMLVKDFIGDNVFYSASGFLRVRDTDLARGGLTATAIRKRLRRDKKKKLESTTYDLLEDTRVHPENQSVAIKIAEQSVEDMPKKSEKRSDRNAHIFEVMENPELLDALDLEQYARDLEAKGRGKNKENVQLIVDEFLQPFKDWRRPLGNASADAIFKSVTGLDPATHVRCGAIVTGANVRLIPNGIGFSCIVAQFVRGFIHKHEVSDNQLSEEDMESLAMDGNQVTCRVMECNTQNFDAKLSCRTSVMKDPRALHNYRDPDFYDEYCLRYEDIRDDKFLEEQAAQQKRRGQARERMQLQKRKDSLARRSTRHAFWKDVSADEAERLIEQANVGEIIIRPGSTPKSVSFTYKLFDGIVGHYKVVEEEDTLNGLTKTLVYVEANAGTAAERFDDLDEVLTRVIDPIIGNYNDAVNYRRKFMNLAWPELQAILREEKRRDSRTIPYLFCPDRRRERVGTFSLGFVPGTKTVQRATIVVTADGFKLRGVLHPTMGALFDWFKKNFKTLEGVGLPPGTPRALLGQETPGLAPATPGRDSGLVARTGANVVSAAAAALATGVRPGTPGTTGRGSRPGTPGRGSRPGTPSRIPAVVKTVPDPAPLPQSNGWDSKEPIYTSAPLTNAGVIPPPPSTAPPTSPGYRDGPPRQDYYDYDDRARERPPPPRSPGYWDGPPGPPGPPALPGSGGPPARSSYRDGPPPPRSRGYRDESPPPRSPGYRNDPPPQRSSGYRDAPPPPPESQDGPRDVTPREGPARNGHGPAWRGTRPVPAWQTQQGQ